MFSRLASLACVLVVVAACSSKPQTGVDQGIDGGSGTVDVYGDTYPSNPEPGTQADLAVNIGDRVFFGYDSSVIEPEGQATLSRQAEWLQRYPHVTVTVEGHCDERGTREYNLALGERRAAAVRNYLLSLGVPSNRISTISYGKERPNQLGSDEESWRLNRRGVTVVN